MKIFFHFFSKCSKTFFSNEKNLKYVILVMKGYNYRLQKDFKNILRYVMHQNVQIL